MSDLNFCLYIFKCDRTLKSTFPHRQRNLNCIERGLWSLWECHVKVSYVWQTICLFRIFCCYWRESNLVNWSRLPKKCSHDILVIIQVLEFINLVRWNIYRTQVKWFIYVVHVWARNWVHFVQLVWRSGRTSKTRISCASRRWQYACMHCMRGRVEDETSKPRNPIKRIHCTTH